MRGMLPILKIKRLYLGNGIAKQKLQMRNTATFGVMMNPILELDTHMMRNNCVTPWTSPSMQPVTTAAPICL